MQKLIISLICCLLPVLALADELTIRPDAPDSYTVVKGDTLWDISGKFFKDPWKWPQIWGLNKEAIKNPHWIYPGDVIVLDRLHKALQVTPGATGPATTAESGVPPAAPPQQRQLYGERLSPHVMVGPGEHDAIPSIPYADIKPFLNQALVLKEGELNDAPEIVAGLERSLLADGDTAYVRDLPTNNGTEWQVYRSGSALIDPDTGDTLGYEALFLGNARVEQFGKVSTLQIYGAKQEIHPGDHLVQTPEEFPENFIPRAPDDDITARVIKIVNGISMAGPGSVIIINKGRRDGLQNGHVLALYHKGATVQRGNYGLSEDTDLPDVRYGLIFVFRTFEKVSYALVMDAKLPVEVLDLAETP
jgi:LysM domain